MTISQEDAHGCFTQDCQNRASFRAISLSLFPDEHRKLVSDVVTYLLCKDHLKGFLGWSAEGLVPAETPLRADESEGQGFARSTALVVVPLSLTSAEAEQLIAEPKANPTKQAVN